MTEPGLPTLLAHPALAYFLAAVTIGAAAILLLRAAWRIPVAARAAWWRPLSLLSEVLLALGLIGLGVFGGRITLAANQVLLAGQVASARDAVDARLTQVAADYCAQPPAPAARARSAPGAALPPFSPTVAARAKWAPPRCCSGRSRARPCANSAPAIPAASTMFSAATTIARARSRRPTNSLVKSMRWPLRWRRHASSAPCWRPCMKTGIGALPSWPCSWPAPAWRSGSRARAPAF